MTTLADEQATTAWQQHTAISPFVVTPSTRSFFTSYYRHFHHRDLSDEDIVQLVTKAQHSAFERGKFRWPCMTQWKFSYPRATQHPHYDQIIQHHPSVSTLRVLDIGCCMGTDLRQMILHGIQPSHVLGLELEQPFIEVGLDVLFNDRAILGDHYISYDILDEDFKHHPTIQRFGTFDVIYCSSVYHCLDEQPTHTLTRHAYQLLSPGGPLFGRTVGSKSEPFTAHRHGINMFMHSTASFRAMCEAEGFVDVEFEQKDDPLDPVHWEGSAVFAFYARKPSVSGAEKGQSA